MNSLIRNTLKTLRLYEPIIAVKDFLTNTDGKYVKLYSQFISKGDLCFDIGANVGRRTMVFLKLNAVVVAVEPQPYCVNILRKKYSNNKNVILIEKGIGDKKGQAKMMLCDAPSLSTFSKDWMNGVKASGRYADCRWEKELIVPVTTLDELILEYGKPSFIKIDVEGYEYQALKGLSQPVKYICFEFTSELIDSAVDCINRISEIGPARFNYCVESDQFSLVLQEWVTSDRMREILLSLRDKKLTGDIYSRLCT